jgi:hypothetical protein
MSSTRSKLFSILFQHSQTGKFRLDKAFNIDFVQTYTCCHAETLYGSEFGYEYKEESEIEIRIFNIQFSIFNVQCLMLQCLRSQKLKRMNLNIEHRELRIYARLKRLIEFCFLLITANLSAGE